MTMNPKIRNCISHFTECLHSILGDKLLSVYLYGSVTLQDYKDGWSDIDLICFTSEQLLPSETERLLMLRQTLVESKKTPMFRKIEGAVVYLSDFLNNHYSQLVYWGTSGQRVTDAYSFDVFSMFELLKYGKLIYGTDIRNQFTLPSYPDLIAGVNQHYETIRKYAQITNESIYSCGWLLDIARCLYTLRYRDIISKTSAGQWALEKNICPCTDDLKKALIIRNNPLEYIDLAETKTWLCSLGPSVQIFADILEKNLKDKKDYFA